MKTIRFTSTRLLGSGKKGILKPDVDGYYELPVGGLNAFNSAGEYYTLQGAEELFKDSSPLIRRMDKGCLKSELGHPKKIPGMTDDQYLERILTIEETNVTSHIKELRLDHQFGVNNPKFKNPGLVAVIAKMKPSGPHGPALESSIQNPSENVCFSIRGITNNYYENGRCYRVLTTIVTFDQVVEQGIAIANKWDSSSLETLYPSLQSVDSTLSEGRVRSFVSRSALVSTESSREMVREALNATSYVELPRIPVFARW